MNGLRTEMRARVAIYTSRGATPADAVHAALDEVLTARLEVAARKLVEANSDRGRNYDNSPDEAATLAILNGEIFGPQLKEAELREPVGDSAAPSQPQPDESAGVSPTSGNTENRAEGYNRPQERGIAAEKPHHKWKTIRHKSEAASSVQPEPRNGK